MVVPVETNKNRLTMEKLTEPVSEIEDGSESELEEGEIANDDIEIIDIVIRHKTNDFGSVSPKRYLPYSRKSNSRFSADDSKSKRHKLNPPSNGKSVSQVKSSSKLNVVKKASPISRSKINPKSEDSKRRNSTHQTGLKSGSSKHSKSFTSETKPRAKSLSKESKHLQTMKDVSLKDDFKWRQSFEIVNIQADHQVVESDSSTSENDEEMELRLAALNSVVVSAKPKNIPVPSSTQIILTKDDSPSEPLITAEETQEDEDEELLRAQLLIEVARKQTKELDMRVQSEVKTQGTEPAKPVALKKTSNPASLLFPIPKLVIDLRDDSSDDGEESWIRDPIGSSIDSLLKSARQTVENKDTVMSKALSQFLPHNQQEEYNRLKQEIVRRESHLLKNGVNKKTTDETCQSSDSSKLPISNSPTFDSANIIVRTEPEQVQVEADIVVKESNVLIPLGVKAIVNSTQNNSNSTTSRNISDTEKTSTNKVSSLKQQLILKKRHLQNLKNSMFTALKNQLELVDRNRSLWQKSNSEVKKLKSMLALAEQNEQQMRTQFTTSQQHAQRLKTKIQTIERQVTSLNLGLVTHRRVANKSNSSATLRIKPKIARVMVKDTSSTAVTANSNTSADDSNSTTEEKLSSKLDGQDAVLHNENWLYGTLGDECNESATSNNFPTWLPFGHSSKFQ